MAVHAYRLNVYVVSKIMYSRYCLFLLIKVYEFYYPMFIHLLHHWYFKGQIHHSLDIMSQLSLSVNRNIHSLKSAPVWRLSRLVLVQAENHEVAIILILQCIAKYVQSSNNTKLRSSYYSKLWSSNNSKFRGSLSRIFKQNALLLSRMFKVHCSAVKQNVQSSLLCC